MKLQEASLNIPEEEYHALPMLSYSNLSKYDREGFGCVPTLNDKFSTDSLTFGSMVDCLMTQGQEEFDKTYTSADIPSMSESLQAVVGVLLDQRDERHLSLVPDDIILDVANLVGFYTRYKDPTRVKKVRDEATVYYNFIKANNGKTVVSEDMYQDALHCAEVLRTNPLTQKYFIPQNPFSPNEVLFQLQLTSEKNGIPFKGMLDLVMIDHEAKIIYPCDLKTSKDVYSFEDSFYTYRYYIQAAMYTQLLKDTIATKCPELADYKIEPYRFIVIDRKVFQPVIFQWTPVDSVVTPSGIERKSWIVLLEELNWALMNQDKHLPQDWYYQLTVKGVVSLNNPTL